MPEDLIVEQKAEALARRAADRAAQLATANAEKDKEIAVARAVRDALVDRDLADHAQHLSTINGSQANMAASLDALETSFSELTTSNAAIAKYVTDQTTDKFSKRTLWFAGAAAAATWAAIIATLVSTVF